MASAHLPATAWSSAEAPAPRSTRTTRGGPAAASPSPVGRTICHSSVGSFTSGTLRSALSTSLA